MYMPVCWKYQVALLSFLSECHITEHYSEQRSHFCRQYTYLCSYNTFIPLFCYYKNRLVHWIPWRTYCWYSTFWLFTVENKIKYKVKIQNQCQSFILQDVKKGYCRKVVVERKKALAWETADKSNQFPAHSRFILFHVCTVENNGTYGSYQHTHIPSHYIWQINSCEPGHTWEKLKLVSLFKTQDQLE